MSATATDEREEMDRSASGPTSIPMAEHTATVSWDRFDAAFTDNRYSRAHRWMFDGGATIPASSSPHVVPVPMSDPMGVDPEEAFVAALSSCHMLWFLSIAAKRGFVVDHYEDQAVGTMARNDAGRRRDDPRGAPARRRVRWCAHCRRLTTCTRCTSRRTTSATSPTR